MYFKRTVEVNTVVHVEITEEDVIEAIETADPLTVFRLINSLNSAIDDKAIEAMKGFPSSHSRLIEQLEKLQTRMSS